MQEFDSGILLIQFGGNDAWRLESKYPPKRDYDHDGDVDWDDNDVRWALKYEEFRNNVKFYIDEARSMHYLPVLITSPNGKKFENGHIVDTRDADKYVKQMKDVGASENVMVLDLHKKSMQEYEKYGKTETDRIFDVCYFRNGNRDYNHFSPQGANIAAGWIRDLACEDPNSKLCREFK
jgi:lysophospholipase L1-like esterase